MAEIKCFTFNVFIENVDGANVAYCLEAGLVATAEDKSELPHKMAKMLARQIDFAMRNNNPGDIYHPAPAEVWEKFLAAKSKVESTQKRITFDDNKGGLVLNQNAYAAAC